MVATHQARGQLSLAFESISWFYLTCHCSPVLDPGFTPRRPQIPTPDGQGGGRGAPRKAQGRRAPPALCRGHTPGLLCWDSFLPCRLQPTPKDTHGQHGCMDLQSVPTQRQPQPACTNEAAGETAIRETIPSTKSIRGHHSDRPNPVPMGSAGSLGAKSPWASHWTDVPSLRAR